jgi:hypothetical protein
MKLTIKRIASLTAALVTATTVAACSDEGCVHTKLDADVWASACAIHGIVYFTQGVHHRDGRETAKTTFPDGSFIVQEWRHGKSSWEETTEAHNKDGSLAVSVRTKEAWDEDRQRYEDERS